MNASNCSTTLHYFLGDLPSRADGLKQLLPLATIGSHRSQAVGTETTGVTETDQATAIAGITEETMAAGGRDQMMRLHSLGGVRAAILPLKTGAKSKSSSLIWTFALSGIQTPDPQLGINAAHHTCVH